MISFTVTTSFKPEHKAFLSSILVPLTLASRAEPGCVHYIPHWLLEEPATLLIYEQYVDEAALEAHRVTAHFAEYVTHGLDPKVLRREFVWMDAIA